MSNLKSIYFYFLATKLNISKKFKTIYFSTKFYDKTLKSKPPKQFYFFPNSFLLSSLTSHKNFSFKLSDIEPDIFWEEKNLEKDFKNLHSFLWLNLIDRKNDNSLIKKIITVWIYKNSRYKKNIWENSVISKRIISWVLNADIILNNADNVFKNDFLESIIIQTNHLKKNIKFENYFLDKIESITAILLTGLVFKDYIDNFNSANKELEKLINNNFDEEGFPLDRNPSNLLKFSKYLVIIKECIKDSQQYVPEYLENIIEKILNCLKSIQTPSEQIPLFNGTSEYELTEYFSYIEKLNYKIKKNKTNVGSIQIIKHKKHTIFLDIGSSPKKNFSRNYQSGPLSFEYFYGSDKVITNCGFGDKISKKAILLSRLTSGQSTMCINDSSVVKFERNKQINTAFGNSIKESFKILTPEFKDDNFEIKSSASHDAYQKKFGCVHKREIVINKKENYLLGIDNIKKAKNNKVAKINIRFHLYPNISAVQTMSGNSVLIQLNKNNSLIFSSDGNKILLEKSIFLGKNKILNNLCINITKDIFSDDVIKWKIRKTI